MMRRKIKNFYEIDKESNDKKQKISIMKIE